MPDMKQVKRSVCNHIRHFSLLSYLPSAGNPSTQPPIRRLALPLIRSITIIPPTTPHTPNSLFSAARTHRQFLRSQRRSHRPHAAPSKYSPFLKVVLAYVLIKCNLLITIIESAFYQSHDSTATRVRQVHDCRCAHSIFHPPFSQTHRYFQ